MVDTSVIDKEKNREFLRPIVKGWLGVAQKAEESKKWFNSIYDQCAKFYSAEMGFMWDDKYRSTFMEVDSAAPKFRITIAKAFEFVALYGPSLFWQNPTRQMKPRKQLELKPEHFLDYGEMGELVYQTELQEQQKELADDDARNQLMEMYLNYTPNEQPFGGLARQSQLAITEALISGRGCLWLESYQYPGSDRTLTGSFFDTNRNLLVDPDSRMCDLSDARYIMRKHTSSRWELEKKFGYKEGSLKGLGTLESADSQGRNNDAKDQSSRHYGETYETVEWYEIWSKCGVGYRLRDQQRGVDPALDRIGDAIEKTCGDYVYLCVAPGLPHPLNAPHDEVREMDAEEMQERFGWPVPYWLDQKWPVQVVDFYTRPGYAWPLAPLAPGLGELTFLNVIISHLANRIWSSSRDIIAIAKSAADELEQIIKNGSDLAIVPINDALQQEINKLVQVLQFPQVNFDVWQIIDRVSDYFDKRVGLTELLYAATSTQSRSAADAQNKEKYTSLRPDYMARCIDDWMEEVADAEKFCARWEVRGHDIEPLVGRVGARMWDEKIIAQDPELTVRNMRARVIANSSRKPNKQKDSDNINQALQYFLATFDRHAASTGDTAPLNELIRLWGDSVEMDTNRIQFGERQPETNGPSPEELQMQQMQMEQQSQAAQQQAMIQQQKADAEMAKAQMDLQAKQMDMQVKQVDAETKAFEAQVKQQTSMQDLEFQRQKQELDLAGQVAGMQMERQKTQAELAMSAQKHQQGLVQSEQAAKTKQQIAKQQAKQKPKPGGNKK